MIPASFGVAGDAIVSDALSFRCIELTFAAAAAGTVWSLIGAQSAAGERVYGVTGDGAIDMTAAKAQLLVQNLTGETNDAGRTALKTGLVTYFTNVPAAADAAFCMAFAVGGLKVKDIAKAELLIAGRASTVAANVANFRINVGNAKVVLPLEPAVNGSNALLKPDGSTAVAAGTDTLVVAPGQGVVFGALASTDVLDVPGATDILILRLWVK